MMTKPLSLLVAAAAALSTAHADDAWYASAKIGANYPDLPQINDGFQADLALGYRLGLESQPSYADNQLSLRFEFNPGFTVNSHTGPGDAGNLWRFMGNALVDLPVTEWGYLYAGGGVGGNLYSLPGLGTDFVFGYQALAGVGFVITEALKLEIGYRFYTSDDQHIAGVTVEAPQFHSVEAGLRVEF